MFYSLSNLSASTVKPVEKPWENIPLPPAFESKEKYQEWCFNAATEHSFVSLVEGVSPTLRVSGVPGKTDEGANPAWKLHGLMVDYDARQDVAERARQAIEHPPCEYLPTHFYPTLRHMRGVWLFEEPVHLPQNAFVVKKFMTMLGKKLCLRKWAAGWEDEAVLQLSKYYAMHGDWVPVAPKYRIPKELLHTWLYAACEDVRLAKGSVEIPIDVVRAEVMRKWPGRWKGPFEIGARGVRFWDPEAKDHTMCVIHKDGVVVFNGDPKPFMTWEDLLTTPFVDGYRAEKIGAILDRTVYDVDSRIYWQRCDDGFWMPRDKGDFAQWLKTEKFNPRLESGRTSTEVDDCEQSIQKTRSVFGARPFVFRPAGILMSQGKPVLNTARTKVIQPVPAGNLFTLRDLRREAPFLWEFLSTVFDDAPDAEIPQMLYFLGWLKRFYEGAYVATPQPGQILVLAGPEACGKTFLTEVIVGLLMGGVADGSGSIAEGDQWSDYLELGVVKVDDAVNNQDPKTRARFQEKLKSLAASPFRAMNVKYKKIGLVEWLGRVIVSMNDDPESLQMIPSLGISAFTKFSFLKCRKPATKFDASRQVNEARALAELPKLARFLLEWPYPEMLIDHRNPRYMLKPYHHKDMLGASVESGREYSLYELLCVFGSNVTPEALIPTDPSKTKGRLKEPNVWEGCCTELLQALSGIQGLNQIVSKYTTHSLGIGLKALVSKGRIHWRKSNGLSLYTIDFELLGGKVTHVKRVPNNIVGDVAEFVKPAAEEPDASQDLVLFKMQEERSVYVERPLHEGILSLMRDEASREGAGQEGGDTSGVSGALLAGAGGDGGGGGRVDVGSPAPVGADPAGEEDVGDEPDGED